MGAASVFFVTDSGFTLIRGTGELIAAGAAADTATFLEVPPEVIASARFVLPVPGGDTGADIGTAEGGVACCEGGWGALAAGDATFDFGALSLDQPTNASAASIKTAATAIRIFLLPVESPAFSMSSAANEGPPAALAEPVGGVRSTA